MDFIRRSFLFSLVAGLVMLVSACDTTEDSFDVTIRIDVDGRGSGIITSRTTGVFIECIVTDGEVSGECEDVWTGLPGPALIRMQAIPGLASKLTWGSPCRDQAGALCEFEFEVGALSTVEFNATFNARTVAVQMTPQSVEINMAGEIGATIVTAQAVDEIGAPVLAATYDWVVGDSTVATITVGIDPRSVTVTGLKTGATSVIATVQGIVGRVGVEVELSGEPNQ